jgi:hypothetical protein
MLTYVFDLTKINGGLMAAPRSQSISRTNLNTSSAAGDLKQATAPLIDIKLEGSLRIINAHRLCGALWLLLPVSTGSNAVSTVDPPPLTLAV